MKIMVINSAEPGVTDYAYPLEKLLNNLGVEVLSMEWRELLSGMPEKDFDGILISASPKGDNANFDERASAFHWLRDIKVPVIGICAGHQFIGHVFGAELIRMQEQEEGACSIRFLMNDPLFHDFPDELTVIQHHNDSMSMPKDFLLLASSDACVNQVMKHRSRPIYGLQWHAEIKGEPLLRNFIDICRKHQSGRE